MNTSTLSGLSGAKPYSTGQAAQVELDKLGEALGAFKPYDSQLTIPEITGTRIVKCLYQISPKTGKKVAENSFVRVPTKHLSEEHVVARIAELAPFVLSWLQGLEDLEIKEFHKQGLLRVETGCLSLDLLLEKLEASEQGARLNKEKIEEWFNSEVLDSLSMLFAQKLGLNDSSTELELLKLEKILDAYKGKFSSLASGKVFIKEDDCKAMIKVIEDCCATSYLGGRFILRLEKMIAKEDDTLLAL